MFHDLRSKDHKERDIQGILHNSLDSQLQPYAIKPKIQYCKEMGADTSISVYHLNVMHRIMLIYKNPKNNKETIIKFFDDEAPYSLRQEKVIKFPTYYAIVSYDYRSLTEQKRDKFICAGLTYATN